MRIFNCGDYEFLSKRYGLVCCCMHKTTQPCIHSGRHPCPYCTINQDEMLSMHVRAGCSQSCSLQSCHGHNQCFLHSAPDMHVCGPIYILVPNVQCSVQMGIVGAKYRVRTAPISRAAL